ncbi:MAG: glycosyltransferase [Candidatus Dojkabacteria bacterium]
MKVSIITSTYNRKNFLEECIKSVQSLKCEPLDIEIEHIVYDDASTDGTDELFTSNKYSNTTYIRGESNKGPAEGRNIAIKKATGDYIFVLDSDDIILQRTIHNFVSVAIENPTTDWFISGFLRVDEKLTYSIGNDYYGWRFSSIENMLDSVFKGEHFIQHNVFFKKELFTKVGGYNSEMRMAEDLDLFVRFLLNKSMPKNIDSISHLHRIHGGNLSAGKDLESHKKDAQIIYSRYKQLEK